MYDILYFMFPYSVFIIGAITALPNPSDLTSGLVLQNFPAVKVK
jgi:hypothetical protein